MNFYDMKELLRLGEHFRGSILCFILYERILDGMEWNVDG